MNRGSLRLVRRYRFSSSHRYYRADWSEEQNAGAFGPCANEPSHGHNYRLWIGVSGPVDPASGFLVDLPELDAIVHRRVVSVVDHRSLNHAIERFRAGQIPSSENVVLWIVDQLERSLPAGNRLEWARLDEDEDLGAEWLAGPTPQA